MPDIYRGKYRDTDYTDGELLEKYIGEVEEVFQRAHEGGRDIAAFLMESLYQVLPGKLFYQKVT
jgi:hypothetical protein